VPSDPHPTLPSNWVTVYTDASVNPHDKLGGWGVWCRASDGRHVNRGTIPPEACLDSSTAELYAIVAGVREARRRWPKAAGIYIRSDNREAVDCVNGKYSRCPIMRRLVAAFTRELGELSFNAKWVKGHSKTQSVKAYVNSVCDRLAKGGRKQAERTGKRNGSHERNQKTSL